jgi:hypothetical protein
MKTASFFTYTGLGRVSIARFAPRGTPAGFRVFKPLAPGPWFNSVDRARYVELYAAEVLERLDARATFERLHELAAGAEPVLLCWEKPSDPGAWCHRALVAQWFGERLGVDVPELGHEGAPHPLAP